ncbi:hypothetical protein ACHAWO_004959 [Cyclotella atomus]|uniref:Uncharacterized protein n=1 Tax=Cyclotella atomus TaxID=382360 RepID=A0ABD3MSP2_9STRA
MMASISSNCLATLLLLSSAFAFVPQHGDPPRLQSFQLGATETFQRSLLEARLNPSKKSNGKAVPAAETAAAARGPSVDYDATARLAYEAAGASGEFEAYKLKYLEETSMLMAAKNPYVKAEEPVAVEKPAAKVSEPVARGPSVDYKAAAKLAYDAAGKPGEFAAFNAKYLEETSAMIAKKNPYVKVEEPPKVEAVKPVASTPEPQPVAPPPPAPVPPPAPKAPLPKTSFTVPREFAVVPVNEATVQFTAGLIGASAGFLLGGPILGAILAAATNYLSRKDDEVTQDTSPKKIVDTASQTALLIYNYLAKFEKDNKIVDTTLKVLEGAVDKAKATETGSPLLAVESTLGGVAKKVEELNDDYDFVKGAETVLNSVGDLVEISVDKVVSLNEEYKLTERLGGVIKGSLNKLTDEK